jgi:hypothetical protein
MRGYRQSFARVIDPPAAARRRISSAGASNRRRGSPIPRTRSETMPKQEAKPMQTPLIRRLSGLTLAVLLVVPAVPATAQQSAPAAAKFELQLEAALEAQGSTFGFAIEPASKETDSAEISLSEMRAEAWTLQEGDDDPAAAMKPDKKRGFGRWLKKHWYVPVIAAVLVGVALGGGDDDKSGEDD